MTMAKVSQGHIKSWISTRPPLIEQLEINSYLNLKCEQFRSLVSKAEAAVSFLQERRTALISAAVTGKIDLRGWQAPKSEVAA